MQWHLCGCKIKILVQKIRKTKTRIREIAKVS